MKSKEYEINSALSEAITYESSDSPIHIFSGFVSNENNIHTRKHWHNDVEFVKVLDGKINYNINGEIVTLEEGDGFFINSKQFHSNLQKDNYSCSFICIILHPVLMCPSKTIAEKYITPILSNPAIPYYVFKKNVEWERNITECLEKIYALRDEEFFELNLYSLFFALWSQMYKNISHKTLKKSPETQHLNELKMMISFIKEHYSEKISLSDIANAGGTCKTSCCSIFKKFTNQTPGAYLTDYRLRKSIELMQNSDMTLTQICFDVGFSGASYFSETFKRIYKISPTEYKKNLGI